MTVRRILRKNVGFLAFLFLLLITRWSLADQYRVPSGSMEPTIRIGDHLAVNKSAYDLKLPFTEHSLLRITEPQRGDIVVFIWPGDQTSIFVKRLIGVPGDRIEIENGFLRINGKDLERAPLSPEEITRYTERLGTHSYTVQRQALGPSAPRLRLTVPSEHYFFMGDNRDESHDSRAWGFVPREALKGKVKGVLWNLNLYSASWSFDPRRIFHPLE